MGYEMIKDKLVITPQRLYSLACLVHQLGTPSCEELLSLLQPTSITDNRETATIIYRYARRYGLVQEDDSAAKRVSLKVDPGKIASVDAFRQHMQTILLGVTDESQDNFLLSQFTAWYATQDEAVLSYTKSEYEMRFNQALYPDAGTACARGRTRNLACGVPGRSSLVGVGRSSLISEKRCALFQIQHCD